MQIWANPTRADTMPGFRDSVIESAAYSGVAVIVVVINGVMRRKVKP